MFDEYRIAFVRIKRAQIGVEVVRVRLRMVRRCNPLQAGIYNRLTGSAALTALVSTRIYDFVPPTAQPPFVKIGEDTAIDWPALAAAAGEHARAVTQGA